MSDSPDRSRSQNGRPDPAPPPKVRRTLARRAAIALNVIAPPAAIALAVSGYWYLGVALIFVAHGLWMVPTMWPSCRWYGDVLSTLSQAAAGTSDTAETHADEPDASKRVWLTIDDGPDPDDTPVLLDLLDAHDAKATFFVIGDRAAAHPDLVREIVDRGHTVGNHTQSHRAYTFWAAGPWQVRSELGGCSDTIEGILGERPRWFRAPVGFKNAFVQEHVDTHGMLLAGWSCRGLDGRDRDVDRIVGRLRDSLHPGATILVHESFADAEGRRMAPRVVGRLLEHLDREGYRCVLPEATS